jgi:hypothetical protein
MSEKMKCPRCGRRFKQANKKQVLCAECLAKDRVAKKHAPQLISSTAGQSLSNLPRRPEAGAMSSGVTIVQTTPPPDEAIYGAQARIAERRIQHTPERSPLLETVAPAKDSTAAPSVPLPSQKDAPQQPAKAPTQPAKRVRQARPTPPPFQLTDEIRVAIEQRYLELSQPVEFDGIRTQIANEMSVPKPAVKQVIRELRAKRQLPSWWELKAYKGTDETLELIRERYLPLLPVPPIGAHKQIASVLQLDAPLVYQAIRRLRAEMKLPQYNPPESHSNETPPAATATADVANTSALE